MIERISFGTAQVEGGCLQVKRTHGERLTVSSGVSGRQAEDLGHVAAFAFQCDCHDRDTTS